MTRPHFSHQTYRVRFDWGRQGVREAAERGDMLVVVDVLSFSTAVVTGVEHGAIIFPCAEGENPQELAAQVGGETAVGRDDVPTRGRFSLSPQTWETAQSSTRVVLPSPNGATCSRYGAASPLLLLGALVNARAVAQAVSVSLASSPWAVTVVACGERWPSPSEDGPLRFALEDYLGAGAILSHLARDASPEAQVCSGAFTHSQDHLAELLRDCDSGRELRERGFGDDVSHAARFSVYDAVPILRDGRFEGWR